MSGTPGAKIKSVIWALFKPFAPANDSTNIVSLSSANRVGPQRVILRVKLDSALAGFEIDRVTFPLEVLEFDLGKPDNENVCISLRMQTTAPPDVEREHKTTLRVRPETNRLTLKFKDANSAIYKTEQIEIT